MTSPFTLAVCAEMVFTDRPIIERVRHIHERGFAVEIWDWTRHDLPALAATGAHFTSMTGYVEGNLTEDDGIEALLRTAADSRLGTRPEQALPRCQPATASPIPGLLSLAAKTLRR